MIKIIVFAVFVICCSPAQILAFTFDNWNSGMTLDEVLTTSEEKDLPVRRDGFISLNKHFDPKTSRAYADKARVFYYNTTLVNEAARVTLLFTKESRLLYEIKVYWQGINVKKALPGAVEDMLIKKYGNPTKSRRFFSKDKIWHLDKNNQLKMKNSGAALQLRYVDLVLEKTDTSEKKKAKQLEKDQEIKKDIDKF